MKLNMKSEKIASGLSPEFAKIYDYIMTLGYKDDPNYNKIRFYVLNILQKNENQAHFADEIMESSLVKEFYERKTGILKKIQQVS